MHSSWEVTFRMCFFLETFLFFWSVKHYLYQVIATCSWYHGTHQISACYRKILVLFSLFFPLLFFFFLQSSRPSYWGDPCRKSCNQHAACFRAAVRVIGVAPLGSSGECNALSLKENAEQMLSCWVRLSATVLDGPVFSQLVCLSL